MMYVGGLLNMTQNHEGLQSPLYHVISCFLFPVALMWRSLCIEWQMSKQVSGFGHSFCINV